MIGNLEVLTEIWVDIQVLELIIEVNLNNIS